MFWKLNPKCTSTSHAALPSGLLCTLTQRSLDTVINETLEAGYSQPCYKAGCPKSHTFVTALAGLQGKPHSGRCRTHLITPWCRVLLEQLIGLQLVKKFPAFHGNPRFITALTSVRHLSLSWASPIQSIYPQPTSWRSILILSTHLRLGLPSGLLPSGFPKKTLYTPLSSPSRC